MKLGSIAALLLAASSVLPAHAMDAAAAARQGVRPNIIFILVDDLGWGDLGAFYQNARAAGGEPALRTPNLDTFATEGARLTHHYCPAPVCAPSRASLLTGVHQGHAEVRDNQFDKALEDNHTLASVLKRAGYRTSAIGKWGLQGAGAGADCPAHPMNRGFDSFYGYLRHVDGHEHYPKENPIQAFHPAANPISVFDGRENVTDGLDKCYTADLFTAKAKHWISNHQQSTPADPFFLYLSYDTPHASLELPTQAYPAGGGLNGGLQWLGTPGRMINTASGTIDSWVHPDCRHGSWLPVYQRYATAVRRIDDAVGDLVQLLKDLKIDDRTLVIFASDNGPECASYLMDPARPKHELPFTPEFFESFGPFEGIKRDCWEGGIRVPALARWPGHVKPGIEVTRPSSFPDWMPTFAALAGWPAPARTDGKPLVADLTGLGTPPPPKPVYVEYAVAGTTPAYPHFDPSRRKRPRGQMQMIRLGDKIGVRYAIQSASDNFEIYNAIHDPAERHNLAANGGEAELQQRMKDTVLQMRYPNPSAPRPYDKAPIPARSAMASAEKPAAGLRFQVFANPSPWVPLTDELTLIRAGESAVIDLARAKPAPHEAVEFSGFLTILQDGDYTFTLSGNGGAFFRIHDIAAIDADQGRLARNPSGTLRLKAGLHPIRLTYTPAAEAGLAIVKSAAPSLSLLWQGPDIPAQPVPESAFSHFQHR